MEPVRAPFLIVFARAKKSTFSNHLFPSIGKNNLKTKMDKKQEELLTSKGSQINSLRLKKAGGAWLLKVIK